MPDFVKKKIIKSTIVNLQSTSPKVYHFIEPKIIAKAEINIHIILLNDQNA